MTSDRTLRERLRASRLNVWQLHPSLWMWPDYVRYWRKYGTWPSRLQRLHMQGDPTGEVQRVSDRIFEEIRKAENEE